MNEMMQLVVGWTLVGAFVFTVIITCFSLVGWVRFADETQQRKLFAALILEVVVGIGTSAFGASRFDAATVREELIEDGGNQVVLELLDEGTARGPGRSQLSRQQALRLVERLKVDRKPAMRDKQQELRDTIQALPEERWSIEAADRLGPVLRSPTVRIVR